MDDVLEFCEESGTDYSDCFSEGFDKYADYDDEKYIATDEPIPKRFRGHSSFETSCAMTLQPATTDLSEVVTREGADGFDGKKFGCRDAMTVFSLIDSEVGSFPLNKRRLYFHN
jgi:hypothetical protein